MCSLYEFRYSKKINKNHSYYEIGTYLNILQCFTQILKHIITLWMTFTRNVYTKNVHYVILLYYLDIRI